MLPAFLEFARGSRAGRAQRAVRRRLPAALTAEAIGLELAAASTSSTPPSSLAGSSTRDEAPNCKLSSLARLFRASTTPNHRALSDARATVDVLHGLIERLGNLGVHTLEELQTFSSRVTSEQRRKRHLAERLPHLPGVYLFRDGRDRGAVRRHVASDLRSRVRTYFTASETRSRMGEMVAASPSRSRASCAPPPLEAEVRELRLIAEHKPPYNRRSKFPERVTWVKLTVEAWPRLSLVKRVLDDGADYLGPFRSRTRRPRRRCPPCTRASRSASAPTTSPSSRIAPPVRSPRWAAVCRRATAPSRCTTTRSPSRRCARPSTRVPRESPRRSASGWRGSPTSERFEEATAHRNRMTSFLRAAARSQRLRALTSCPEVVAARRNDAGGWEVHVVRHGRLAAAGVIPAGASARDWVDSLRASAETVLPGPGPTPAATAEESERMLHWLEQPGVRLVHIDGVWSCPVDGAESLRQSLDSIDVSRESWCRSTRLSGPTLASNRPAPS